MERHTTPRAPEHVSDDNRSSEAPRHSLLALPESLHEEAGYLLAMMRLPVPALGETRELACAVCLDDFQAGDRLKRMPCSHSFHQRCIFQWLRIRPHCPSCRHPLPAVDMQRLLDDLISGQPSTDLKAAHEFFLLR